MGLANALALGKPIAVNSMTRDFHSALPGKKITISKMYDPVTGKAWVVSSDPSIQTSKDIVALEDAEVDFFRGKWGRLNSQLVQKVFLADQSAPETELIRAVVTLKAPVGLEYLERESHSTEELKANSLAVAAAMPVNNMATVLSAYGIGAGASADPFTSVIEATKTQLKRLAKDENVADISEYHSPNSTSSHARSSFVLAIPSLFGQISDNMNTVSRSAYSHSQAAIPSLANGIPAAVFESGLTSAYLNQGCIPAQTLWDPQTVPFTIPGGGSGAPT